jgi:P-type Ca2+ transporter type 2C
MQHANILGLTKADAARLLMTDGFNALPGSEPKSLWRIVIDVLLEPMFLMLLVTGIVYLLIGDTAEAIFLLGSVFAVIGLTLSQERKTQRSLEALRDLSAPRALVIRDGLELRIAGREVVCGDMLVLHEGDRVAADAVLVQGQISTDESLLTGEAVPQDKLLGSPEAVMGLPGGDANAFVFASTVVTRGVGVACVRATASNTAVGRMGAAMASTTLVSSNLQKASRVIVRRLAAVGLIAASALILLAWMWDGKTLLESLLLGLALAMALLPEEIPVVLTVFLALGAWRLSQQRVLTRRVTAVEALGALTVLAVDKTGTLTLNRMEVIELEVDDARYLQTVQTADRDLPEAFHSLLEFALLATPADPFDPMEKAIRSFGLKHLTGTEHAHVDWAPEFSYPLSPEILAMTQVFPIDNPEYHLLATKGAPEAIVDLCHLPDTQREVIASKVQNMANRGLRVLGVAKGQWSGQQWPTTQHDFIFSFLGLLGLADPPRPEVPAAIRACQSAGIRIIMMTGDHPATARAIARQIGLGDEETVLTGPAMSMLDDETLRKRLETAQVCARLVPEQKLRLVRLLQKNGETVGMTGDGVNDAPALKAADVGVAMGERGTDVAREAAAIVLLDDSFASITTAIRQGRRIYDNISAATRFIFAVHVPVVALALGAVLFHWPMLLLPVQIVLMELLIDPACSVVFEAEPESGDIMDRPPRASNASPFTIENVGYAMLQGTGLAIVLLGSAWGMMSLGWESGHIRASVFAGLVLGLFLLVIANRDLRHSLFTNLWLRNAWLVRMVWFVTGMLVLIVIVPWLRQVMGFSTPPIAGLGIVTAILLATMAWMEVLRIGRLQYVRR